MPGTDFKESRALLAC